MVTGLAFAVHGIDLVYKDPKQALMPKVPEKVKILKTNKNSSFPNLKLHFFYFVNVDHRKAQDGRNRRLHFSLSTAGCSFHHARVQRTNKEYAIYVIGSLTIFNYNWNIGYLLGSTIMTINDKGNIGHQNRTYN